MVTLNVSKFTTGGILCIVRHNWGRGTWSEMIRGELRDGKEYARFQVEPKLEVRLRCVGGEIVAETRNQITGDVATVRRSPPPWVYTKG